MKSLLVLTILIQTFLLGLVGGGTYILRERQLKSEACFEQILASDVILKDRFGHSIQKENIWPHAESAVASQYLKCMNRRDL